MAKNNIKLDLRFLKQGLTKYRDIQTKKFIYSFDFRINNGKNYILNTKNNNKLILDEIIKFIKRNKDWKNYKYNIFAEYYDAISGKSITNGYKHCSKISNLDNLRFNTYDSLSYYVDKFTVNVYHNNNSKIAGDNDKNDCVFLSILQAFNYDKSKLPKLINKDYKFKKYLGYEREDKVDVVDSISKIEKLFKNVSFNICGDVEYNSIETKSMNIRLKVKNNHCQLMNNKGKKPIITINQDKLKIISYCFSDCGEYVLTYNGQKQNKINMNEYIELKKNNYKNNIIKILADDKDDLENKYNEYIDKIDFYQKDTNGKINFKICNSVGFIAFERWRYLSKNINTPEELTNLEENALCYSNRGGLHYGSRQTIDTIYEYDQNNMYLHYMRLLNFTFPNKQPDEIKKITTDEFNDYYNTKKYLAFGIYKCKITGDSIYVPNSQKNDYQWHNHHTLTISLLEKCKIEMDMTIGCNVLYYTKNRLNGNKVFGDYSKEMNDMKMRHKGTKYYDTSKLFSTALHGYFTKKNKSIQRYNMNEIIDIDPYNIIWKKETKNEKYVTFKMQNTDNGIFKNNYARIGSFLTGYCRLKLYELLKSNFKDDEILYINTDGFQTTKPLPDKYIGNLMGMFKIVKK